MAKAKRRNIVVNKRVRSKYRLFAAIAALLLLVGGGIFFWKHDSEPKKDQPNSQQTAESTNETPSQPDQTATTPTPSEDPKPKDQSDTPPTQGAGPIKPFGEGFVNNHAPKLQGSWEENQMQSVCNTSAGADCVITFTKGGVKKSLPSQKADGEGAVYWSWTLQDIGLTEGTWKVTATATMNSQSASADDPIALEVKP